MLQPRARGNSFLSLLIPVLIKHIPGGSKLQFSHRRKILGHQRDVIKKVAKHWRSLESLKQINDATKQLIREKFRFHQVHLAAVDLRKENFNEIVWRYLAPLSFLVAALIAPATIALDRDPTFPFFIWIFYIPLCWVFIFLFSMFVFIATETLEWILKYLNFSEKSVTAYNISLLLLSTTIYAQIFISSNWQFPLIFQFISYSAAAGILGAAMIGGFFLCLLTLLRFAETVVNWRRSVRYADAVVVDGLIKVLYLTEKSDATWGGARGRQKILITLEKVASCIEYNLPRQLHSGDLMSDNYLEKSSEEIATWLRSLKIWVITPKIDTKVIFSKEIANSIECIATGNWDKLKRKTIGNIATSSLRTQIFVAGKTIIVSFLPLVILEIFQRLLLTLDSQITLDPQIASTARLAAFAWSVVTLLIWLDPASFSTKIETIKDIKQLFDK